MSLCSGSNQVSYLLEPILICSVLIKVWITQVIVWILSRYWHKMIKKSYDKWRFLCKFIALFIIKHFGHVGQFCGSAINCSSSDRLSIWTCDLVVYIRSYNAKDPSVLPITTKWLYQLYQIYSISDVWACTFKVCRSKWFSWKSAFCQFRELLPVYCTSVSSLSHSAVKLCLQIT